MRARRTTLGQQPSVRHLHQAGVEAVGAADQKRLLRHRGHDGDRDVIGGGQQRGEAARHGGEGHGGVGRAAPVDAVVDLCGLTSGEGLHHAADALLDRMGGIEVGVQRRVEGARRGQHPRVLTGAIVEDRQRLVHLVARRRRRGFEVGPVRAALQRRVLDPDPPQQVAHELHMARLAVVRGGHDGDVLGAQAVARGDPGPQACDRLERLGTGPKVGHVSRIAEAGVQPTLRIDDRQVAEVDGLFDPATLDAHQRGGRVRHSPEYKEGDPPSLDAE